MTMLKMYKMCLSVVKVVLCVCSQEVRICRANKIGSTIVYISVVGPEPELQGARTFGRSQSWNWYTEVLAPAPGQTKLVY